MLNTKHTKEVKSVRNLKDITLKLTKRLSLAALPHQSIVGELRQYVSNIERLCFGGIALYSICWETFYQTLQLVLR